MRIGIDLDEVTTNFMDKLNEFYHKKTGKLFKKEDYFSFNWWEVWGTTRDEAVETEKEFVNSDLYDGIEPLENAIESVNKLIDENEIFVITSRPIRTKEKTEKWLHKHFGKKLNIIFSGDFHGGGKTKAEICKELGINLLLEDHKNYALEAAREGIKVILFDKPWNKGIKHKNIIRVNNWIEALKEINKLTKAGKI